MPVRLDHECQWIGAVYSEDLGLVREMLKEKRELADSLHCEFDDPFRSDRYPVPTLLFAVNGPPPQQLDWHRVERNINFDLVKLLLEFGADPNIECGHGRPLCYVRDLTLAKRLIDHGGDINLWSDVGGSPLFFSVWNADPERLRMQLELGADVSLGDPRTGMSALHALSLQINNTPERESALLEVAEILFAAGIDPNHRTKTDCTSDALECGPALFHDTPLHLAAAHNSLEIIQFLVRHSCDRSLTNANGETPRDCAIRADRDGEIIRELS